MINRKLESNIWKFFIFELTQRRNFISLLAILFLMIPDTKVFQIGLYTGIAAIFSFFLEVPSGYFSDKFGHKRTLILSKILMAISLALYIIAEDFQVFY